MCSPMSVDVFSFHCKNRRKTFFHFFFFISTWMWEDRHFPFLKRSQCNVAKDRMVKSEGSGGSDWIFRQMENGMTPGRRWVHREERDRHWRHIWFSEYGDCQRQGKCLTEVLSGSHLRTHLKDERRHHLQGSSETMKGQLGSRRSVQRRRECPQSCEDSKEEECFTTSPCSYRLKLRPHSISLFFLLSVPDFLTQEIRYNDSVYKNRDPIK